MNLLSKSERLDRFPSNPTGQPAWQIDGFSRV
jgi:hypothetical protein